MSIVTIKDNLILDKSSKELKDQFQNYCNWCWGHGYGNCDICKRIFNKYYIPIRKIELQEKLGLVHNNVWISDVTKPKSNTEVTVVDSCGKEHNDYMWNGYKWVRKVIYNNKVCDFSLESTVCGWKYR